MKSRLNTRQQSVRHGDKTSLCVHTNDVQTHETQIPAHGFGRVSVPPVPPPVSQSSSTPKFSCVQDSTSKDVSGLEPVCYSMSMAVSINIVHRGCALRLLTSPRPIYRACLGVIPSNEHQPASFVTLAHFYAFMALPNIFGTYRASR